MYLREVEVGSYYHPSSLNPGSYCWIELPVGASSIWALQWPIKFLKGLVRNLLAVSRWGVQGRGWLWSVTEVTSDKAGERETVGGRSSVYLLNMDRITHHHTYALLFHACSRISMHVHIKLTLRALCVAWVSAWNLQALFSCNGAGKRITGTLSAEGSLLLFHYLFPSR